MPFYREKARDGYGICVISVTFSKYCKGSVTLWVLVVLLNLRRTVVGTFCTPTSKNLRYSTYLYALAVQRFLFRSLALRTCTRLLFNASFFARSLALSLVSMYVVVCYFYCRRRYEAYCVACPNKFFSNFNVVFILSSRRRGGQQQSTCQDVTEDDVVGAVVVRCCHRVVVWAVQSMILWFLFELLVFCWALLWASSTILFWGCFRCLVNNAAHDDDVVVCSNRCCRWSTMRPFLSLVAAKKQSLIWQPVIR